MTDNEPQTVQKRSVFLIGGYEPKSSDAFFKRTKRELGRFADTWGVNAGMAQQQLSEDRLLATARVDTNFNGKKVETDINFFVWNDIVLNDFSQPTLLRAAKYIVTFFDYLLTGTFFRIVKQAWRFGLYFLYPAFMLLLFSVLSVGAGRWVTATGFPGAPLAGMLVALTLLIALLRISGRRWFVLHLMDLWSFSRGYLRGQREDAEAHIERFAAAVVAQYQRGVDDEIVLVGHSTGGALILDIAATALQRFPELGQHGPRITVLTVGSTALKIGLHPAASQFRRKVQSLVDAESINWIECQAHTDIVNFYRTDPVAAMHLTPRPAQAFPQVHVVRIRDMLQPEVYKRFKYNIFRVHYQFIMANTQRYTYDFFMMCCGARRLEQTLGDALRYQSGKG